MLRRNKSILTLTSVLKACACPVWMLAYGLIGDARSAAIPLGYCLCTAASLVHFARTKRFAGFRLRQGLLIFLLPLFMHVSLGGFVASSGVILWSLLGPLTFLLFQGARQSVIWFALFVLAVAGAGLAEGALSAAPTAVPAGLRTCFFAMNIITVSGIVYAAVRYFVGLLAEEQEKLARLIASSAEAFDDVTRWSTLVAAQVAEAIGADEVAVWTVEAEQMTNITGGATGAPTRDDVLVAARRKTGLQRPSDTVIPVLGLSGDVYGALVVAGRNVTWSEATRRVVDSFARHLGSALELARMRKALAEAAERRRATHEDMLRRGIDILHLCPQCSRCYDQNALRCSDDGCELSAPRPLPYRIAGRHRLIKVVGSGGMGTVYKAHDERLGRDVAVKIIKAEHFNDERIRMRFEMEARAVARIDHPGVATVYDSGELEDGSLYIVMEWLKGCDLAQLLRRCGPGTPAQVARLLRAGSAALGAAHAAGLIHRDIKPENLFLVPTPGAPGGFDVKVLDFGVVKEVSSEDRVTRTGMLIGTPMYMSPEQIHEKAVDTRSDVYSFAAVIYEALTGRRVCRSDQFAAILFDIVKYTPPPVSSFVPHTPAGVDAAIARALAKSREQRPADIVAWAASFAQALEAVPSPCRGWVLQDGGDDWAAAYLADTIEVSRERGERASTPTAATQAAVATAALPRP